MTTTVDSQTRAPGIPGQRAGFWQQPARLGWLAIGAITGIALLLRAMGVGGELWLDEMYASKLSFRRPFLDLLTVYEGDNQHPLYSLLSHASIVLFGESPAAIRLPALLFGVASVPMVYVLGLRVVSRLEALLGATLLAVSYHHVWFSQNARGYTMLAFWTLLATYFLLRGIRERRALFFICYGLVAALGIYTHLTMVFVIAAHVLTCAWQIVWPHGGKRLDWQLPVIGFAIGAALTLLLYAPILMQVFNFFANRPSRLLGVSSPAWALGEGLRILRLGVGGGWTMVVGGAVFVIGLISVLRRSPLVFALFVLPAATTTVGALAGRGTMYPRFFFFLSGIAVLIAVRGAFALASAIEAHARAPWPRLSLRNALGCAFVAAAIIASATSLRYNYAFPKQAFQQAAAYVESSAAAAEPVGVLNATWYAYIEYYGKPWRRLTFRDDPSDNPAANLAQLRAHGRTVWLVYTFTRYLEHEAPAIMATIRAECVSARRFDSTVGDGDVFVCALPPRPAPV